MPLKITELRETGWLIIVHGINEVNWKLLPISVALTPASQGGHRDRNAEIPDAENHVQPHTKTCSCCAGDNCSCLRPALWLRLNSYSILIVMARRLPGDYHCLSLRRTKDSSSQTEDSKTNVWGHNFISLMLTLSEFVQWTSEVFTAMKIAACESHQSTSKWNPILYLVSIPEGKARSNRLLLFLTALMLSFLSISTWRANSINACQFTNWLTC